MKKKFLSLLLAASMCASAAPMTTSATYYVLEDSSNEINESIKNLNMVPIPSSYLRHYFDYNKADSYYYYELGTNGRIMGLKKLPNMIVYRLADEKTLDDVKAALAEFNEAEGTDYYSGAYHSYADPSVGINDYYIKSNENKFFGSDDASKLLAALKEKALVSGFNYKGDRVQKITMNGSFDRYNTRLGGDPDALKEFIESSGLDCTVTINDIGYAVVECERELSLFERIDLANKIYDEAGLYPEWVTLSSNSEYSGDVDMFNAVEGDANADGELSIDDAVAVMQSIANPDKYKLSHQGEYNADMNGDGITAKDALRIQEKLLGR